AVPRFPRVSPTSEGLSSAVFSSLLERARASGKHVYPLHVGDTYLAPVFEAQAEAQRAAEIPRLHNYPGVHGVPELLRALAARISARGDRPIDVGQVQVVAGATSGLSVLFQTVLDPGDEVLLLAPYWPLVRGIVASRGGVPVEVPFFDRVGAEGFDAEAALEAAVSPRTVALYVNSPHNPTGHVLDRSTMDALARVATRHNLWIVSDEAYEDFWYTETRPEPVWNHPGLRERTVAAHTFSKGYGLAGGRVGYLHGPGEIIAKLRSVHTFQAYCAPHPMQWSALRALEHGDAWIAKARSAYAEAGRRAAAALGVPAPAGGTFIFFDARPYLRSG
ncbi:MAG: pyridoxal phosphate-dependent aminotransferase, partial [Myxococcales bacterium]|nr:pyridoxal phosphate-dependent aminotransferase [Myxococcales bacterium]